MSKSTDWPPNIKQRDFDKFFSAYRDSSPLASVLTPAQTNAVANFNANTRSPGMAEEAIPGVEPTVIPKLDPLKFGMPVGMGSWQNIPADKLRDWFEAKSVPASVQTWDKKHEIDDIKWAEGQARVKKIILTNPELAGQDPTAWTEKGILKFLETQKNLQPKNDTVAERKRHNQVMEGKKRGDRTTIMPSTGTVTGGGVAPSDTKLIGGKTFKRINGNWVQQ